jgi:hypothetical protein
MFDYKVCFYFDSITLNNDMQNTRGIKGIWLTQNYDNYCYNCKCGKNTINNHTYYKTQRFMWFTQILGYVHQGKALVVLLFRSRRLQHLTHSHLTLHSLYGHT